MVKEDKLVQELVADYRESERIHKEVQLTTEAHYNYYGDRGVVDLHVRKKQEESKGLWTHDTLYEVKSTEAVNQATGANEIIRQFNRMRSYFYKDESWPRPDDITFNLCFIPTKETVEHVMKNLTLYVSARDSPSDIRLPGGRRPESIITFIEPEDPSGNVLRLDRLTSDVENTEPEAVKQHLDRFNFESGTYGKVLGYMDDLGY